MWQRRAKRLAVTLLAVFAVGSAGTAGLWRDRANLEDIDWLTPPEPDDAALTVTWLGVTTVLVDDGETQILVDGFFSRPTLADILLQRPVNNDAATINSALYEYDIRNLAVVIPAHSHFDHAMDVGEIALRSKASVLGSESTANIARGAGVLEDQLVIATPGEAYAFGDFSVRLLESRHGPIGWRGSVPLPGTIDEPIEFPAPIQSMRLGAAYTIVIEHPRGTTVVQGNSGFIEDELKEVNADLVLLCTFGLSSLGRDYAEKYWQEMVTKTGAKAVMPMHFDDFTRPFGEITPFPRILDDIEKSARWLEEFRDTWDTDTALYKPAFGQRVEVYSQASSST